MEFPKRLFGQATQRSSYDPTTATPLTPPIASRSVSFRSCGMDRFGKIDELDLMGPFMHSPYRRLILLYGALVSEDPHDERAGGYAVLEGTHVRGLRARRTAPGRQDSSYSTTDLTMGS